jgi:hypothetical protein
MYIKENTMRMNFTNLENAIKTFTDEVINCQKQLFEQANENRRQLLAIYQNLMDNSADITKFGDMLSDTACALFDVNAVCEHVVDKISGALDFGYDQIPQCSFENYVDTCEICGLDIMHDQEYTEGENGLVHSHCLDSATKVEETVESEEEEAFEKDELPTT